MESKFIHSRLGAITLCQSNRARHIAISIKASGQVRLSYPYCVSSIKALAFLESKISWIERTKEKIVQRATPHSEEEIKQLRIKAKQTLPQKVETLAAKFGFKYGRVTIRATHSKWGCCTASNNLSLSLFLADLPEELQDFVILHELCHTVHHNHSASFHTLLNSCTNGKEAKLNRELRKYHPI